MMYKSFGLATIHATSEEGLTAGKTAFLISTITNIYMETIQIIKTNALKAYNEADSKGKALLVNLFGKKVLSEKITDRIKTIEDVFEELGQDQSKEIPEGLPEHVKAFILVTKIAEVLNEGWTPDWDNSNQYKWYPYFDMRGAGFGFSGTIYDYWYADATVGSRLCFKSDELAKYAGTQFIQVYKTLLK
jgi:hypothetical protein